VTCSLWSIKSIILTPNSCHFLICLIRSRRNKTSGQVRSFFLLMKYLRCCWYVVPELTILFLHGLYAVTIIVWCPLFPPRSIQHHLPRPFSSCPVFLMYPTKSLKQIVPVPPSCTLPVLLALCTLWALTAVHASSRWNICFRLFLLSLCWKLRRCLQYIRQLILRSSLMSNCNLVVSSNLVVEAVAIFPHDAEDTVLLRVWS
jgi:hypothetical protein